VTMFVLVGIAAAVVLLGMFPAVLQGWIASFYPVMKAETCPSKTSIFEVCALPPSRQKEGAKTGHGAFMPGPARVMPALTC